MQVLDSLRSLIGGLGNPERDKQASVYHGAPVVDRQQLENAYAGNWIARKIVDIPARDALRKWRTWSVDEPERVEAEEQRLGLRGRVLDALIDARLYGGAALYIGTEQEPAEPLDLARIGPGGLRYVTVLGPDVLTPGPIVQDPANEYYGRPEHYRLSGTANATEVHPSRLAIMRADRRAGGTRLSGFDGGWDASVLIAAGEIIRQSAGAFANVASLLHEANVDVIGIPDLMLTLQNNPDAESLLLRRFAIASANKGVNKSLMLDSLETYERKGATFADLPHVIETFALFAAAAADIPATRFLARSPTGLTSTGSHEMTNYHDRLQAMQELEIGPSLANLDACLVRSAGIADAEGARYDWRPLEQMSEDEISEIGKRTVEYLQGLNESGLYTQAEMRELWTHKLAESKVLPHIEHIVAETGAALALEEPDEDEDEDDEVPGRA